MNDLHKLIEAVETSVWPLNAPTDRRLAVEWTHICSAFNGSLDAAKALHEALLPRWRVENLSHHSFHDQWWCSLHRPVEGDEDTGVITRHSATVSAFNQDVASRAWLLAILRAYAAQQEPTP